MAWQGIKRWHLIAAGAAGAAGLVAWTALKPPDGNIRIESDYVVGDDQFRRVMGHLLGPPLEDGNRIVSLSNGVEIFPAMLQAIAGAQETITLETYIYWSGKVGRQFTDALSERARAGVKVHVIIDAVGGAQANQDYVRKMRDAGVNVVLYHPLRWHDFGSAVRFNNRTHRKILVVDGRVGFTGGVGIADVWLGDADSPEHWRDMHYQIEGPAVAHLQAAFVDNWMEGTGEVLDGEAYFPPQERTGDAVAQVFMSSSEGGSSSMQLMYMLSIAAAQHTIRLASSYFVPDELTTRMLVEARKRDVSVRIIVPGPIMDERLVQKASRARWGELLDAGVEIYEYQPTMYHCKIMIVDDLWVSIGSANLDNRSFRLNDEANLNVLDAAFAAQQSRFFEQDRRLSRRITLEEWLHRPWHEQAVERAASVLGPQL